MKLLQRFLPKAIRENLKTTHLETIFWNNNHPNMNFWDYFYLFFSNKNIILWCLVNPLFPPNVLTPLQK